MVVTHHLITQKLKFEKGDAAMLRLQRRQPCPHKDVLQVTGQGILS